MRSRLYDIGNWDYIGYSIRWNAFTQWEGYCWAVSHIHIRDQTGRRFSGKQTYTTFCPFFITSVDRDSWWFWFFALPERWAAISARKPYACVTQELWMICGEISKLTNTLVMLSLSLSLSFSFVGIFSEENVYWSTFHIFLLVLVHLTINRLIHRKNQFWKFPNF